MPDLSFKDQHQQFINNTNNLSQQVKDELIEQFAKNFDLDEVLENPEIGQELLAIFIEQFSDYYREAIQMGLAFGEVKVKQFTNGQTS